MIVKRLLLLALLGLSGCRSGCAATPSIDRLAREPKTEVHALERTLIFHPVRVDAQKGIVPWSDHEAPFHEVAALSFKRFSAIPNADHGFPPYFTASMFEGDSFAPAGWVHNPTGLAAMLVRSSLRWHAYAGDAEPLKKTRALVDHVLAHGLTAESDAWSRVPFASGDAGQLDYKGGDDTKYCEHHDTCGRGDGPGVLEPDKIGELGHALVLLYEATGEAKYLATAIHFGDELARHVRPGDAKSSPWPFRVDAKTGEKVREPWTTNVIFTISLFDELERLGKASDAHRKARALTWTWLMDRPLRDHTWQGFFEDIPVHVEPGTNPNQYSPGEVARYLINHPERDPEWRAHAQSIVGWIAKTFANDDQGAEAISEQRADMAKMGSHTARYASLLAMLHEKTGDPSLRARAFRSFSWATYGTHESGLVRVSPDEGEGYWFSDGYGDYMIHFLDGIAAVPAWAPSAENHLLRGSSVVTKIAYGPKEIRYSTFDAQGDEELRLVSPVKAIEGATFTSKDIPGGGVWIHVHHDASRDVHLTL